MIRIARVCLTLIALSIPTVGAQAATAASCPTTEAALRALISTGGTVSLSCPSATTIAFTSTISIGAGQSVTLDASASPGRISFDGGGAVELFSNARGTLALSGVTLAHGYSSIAGGAVGNYLGTLSITDSTLSGNSAAAGGAIENDGALVINSSALYGNSAVSDGGAIVNGGDASSTVAIINSTLSGNSASRGGAITQVAPGPVSISDSTLAQNSAVLGASIADLDGTVRLKATIVADGRGGGGNCYYPDREPGLIDDGYNLEDDAGASCGFSAGSHDLVGQDPGLGPLADNGGPTETMALHAGSPAIGQVPAALCPASDQRGAGRPGADKRACDIGAYEFWESCPDTTAALAGLIQDGVASLRCPVPTVVTITTPIEVGADLTIDASNSPARITLAGGGSSRLFVNFAALTLDQLTLTGGQADTGGAIYNEGSGSLTLDDTTVSGSSAARSGGAIWNGGDLTIERSTLSGNSADSGGAIYNSESARTRISNSTIADNLADDGGAILNDNDLTIENSTIAANSGAYEGGGISNTGAITISATIVADNDGENCFDRGSISDRGYNLEDDSGGGCGFSQSNLDIVGTSAGLGPLADNGGPTQTIALLPGSPAIARIPTSSGLCPPSDERGAARPGTGKNACDIGAYESSSGGLGGSPGVIVRLSCRTVTRPTRTGAPGTRASRERRRLIRCRVGRSAGASSEGPVRATISRGHVRYAVGTRVRSRKGRFELVVEELRPLRHGRYELTLRYPPHHRRRIERLTIHIG